MKEQLRHFLHRVVSSTVRLRSRPLALTTGSRCVIVAPHQDDEALGCAGLILARRTANLPVTIIYLTDGSGSHPNHPRLLPAEIAPLRRQEAQQAMQLLHVDRTSLHFLDAPDGALSTLDRVARDSLAQRLASVLTALQPTELYLPCEADSSSEHTGGFQLTRRALHLASLAPRVLEYPIWARWRPQHLLRLGLTSRRVWHLAFPQHAALKRAALEAYVTQTEPTPPWRDPVLPRGFVHCFTAAEEFFLER